MKRIAAFLIGITLVVGMIGCSGEEGTLVGPAGGQVTGAGGMTINSTGCSGRGAVDHNQHS
jgi:hypothetical protein